MDKCDERAFRAVMFERDQWQGQITALRAQLTHEQSCMAAWMEKLRVAERELAATESALAEAQKAFSLLQAILSDGYRSGRCMTNDYGCKVALNFASNVQAENAFNAITDLIDAAMKEGK